MATPGALLEAFERGVAPALRGTFGAPADVERTLVELLQTARSAWPALEFDDAAFIEHLASRLTEGSELAPLHAADLALAFCCLLGDPAALTAFDREVLPKATAALKGSLPAGMTEDDVRQSLRLKLFVRQAESPPGIATYSGRGALVHWLRASAVRVTHDFARTRRLEVATPDEDLAESPAVGHDADVAFLKRHFAPQFKAAFQAAVAELSPRDQNLLKLQYLDGSSPEEIGRLYNTHRTTVWRWLTQCREELLKKTRAHLAAQVKVGEGEFTSLMNAVHSQLDVSLSRLLGKG